MKLNYVRIVDCTFTAAIATSSIVLSVKDATENWMSSSDKTEIALFRVHANTYAQVPTTAKQSKQNVL